MELTSFEKLEYFMAIIMIAFGLPSVTILCAEVLTHLGAGILASHKGDRA